MKIRNTYIWLTILVILLNLFFLRDSWGIGMIGEDYRSVLYFIINFDTGNIITKLINFWFKELPYYGSGTVYLGGLAVLFGGNYLIIQIINTIAKIIASVLFYAVIFKFTKNKPLAILSCIFFSISYAAAGFLQSHGVSAAYWGIVFYFIFALNYQTIISNNRNHKKNHILIYIFSVILIYFALAFGLLRLIAVPGLIFAAEVLMVFTKYSSWKDSLRRTILFLVLPVLIVHFHGLLLNSSNNIGILDSTLVRMMKQITDGNYFIFLSPLIGLALTLTPRDMFTIMSVYSFPDFPGYFLYMTKTLGGIFIFFALSFTFLLPVNRRRYLVISSTLGILITLLIYLMSINYTGSPRFDMIPEILTGGLILALTLPLGIEGIFGKKGNLLLLVAFFSPLITFYFVLINWLLIMGRELSIAYEDSVHRYLTVPSLGTSMLLASIILLTLRKKYPSILTKVWSIGLITIILLWVIVSDFKEMDYFKKEKARGVNIWDMKKQQEKFSNNYLKNGDLVLYYIQTSTLPADALLEQAIKFDMVGQTAYLNKYFNKSENPNGCVMVINNLSSFKDGYLNFSAWCPIQPGEIKGQYFATTKIIKMPVEKLFSYTFNKGRIIDVTPWVKTAILKGLDPETEVKRYISTK